MEHAYRLAADVIVVLHLAYVLFILVGLVLILLGAARRWRWTRNAYFRCAHLAAIAIVVVEALCGVTCPLTVWEKAFRARAGDATYRGDFLARWAHDILFIDAAPWAFTLVYCLLGLAVLAAFVVAPPQFNRSNASLRR